MGIFTTNADTYANGFYGPQNGAYNNPGWQVDPNLMTPGYSALYRPQYDGYGPYQNTSNPGFFAGVGRIANPFYTPPLYQSPGQASDPYFDAASYRPADAFMTGMQRYVVPGLAMGAAMKYLGPNTGSFMKDVAGTFAGKGIAGSFGKGVGSRMFGHAAAGLGMGGRAVGMASSVGGVIGGTIGAFALPYMAANAVASIADNTVFDPYVQTRQAAADLRRNFAGVTFNDSQGNFARGGRGLSQVESTRLAADITRGGIQDFAFSRDEYTAVANMSAKAGLLDNSNSKDLAKKIKSIAEQVKLIVQISQDPSIQNAIEELSKLQQGGASLAGGRLSQGAQAYSQLGMSASAAGTTVQRLMERVGQQGQMLYSMNGMTPFMGQLAAGNLYAGFSSGYRTGLIGEAQLARMGGLEGATQSALTGAVNALQTPFARMSMYNMYVGNGQSGGSVASVVGGFGRAMGGNPLAGMGTQLLFGNQMAARYMQDRGLSGIEEQAVQMLRSMGQRPGPGGKFSASQLAMALQASGMSPDQIQAFMAQRASETNPDAQSQRLRGYDAQAFETTRGFLDSEGLLQTTLGRAVHGVKQFGKNAAEGIADYTAIPLAKGAAAVGDAVRRGYDSFWYGDSVSYGKEMTSDQLFGNLSDQYLAAGYKKDNDYLYSANFRGFNSDLIGRGRRKSGSLDVSKSKGIAETIQKIATNMGHPGSKLARELMSTTDPAKRRSLLSQLTKTYAKDFAEGTYGSLFTSGYDSTKGIDNAGQFLEDIAGSQTKHVLAVVDPKANSEFGASLDRVLGQNDFTQFDDLRMIGKISDLTARHGRGELDSGNIDDVISGDKELQRLFGNKRGTAAMEYLTGAANRMLNEGQMVKGDIALSIGSVEENSRTGGRNIRDPDLRQKFQRAARAKDRQGMERALTEYAVRLNGGSTKEMTLSGSRSLNDSARAASELRKAGQMKAKDVANSADSAVDYEKTFTDVVKKFDQPITSFNAGVSQFVQAVQDFRAAQAGTGLTPGFTGSNNFSFR